MHLNQRYDIIIADEKITGGRTPQTVTQRRCTGSAFIRHGSNSRSITFLVTKSHRVTTVPHTTQQHNHLPASLSIDTSSPV